MRSNIRTACVALVSTLLVAQGALADDIQNQLERMEQRMIELENKLQATTDQLAAANERVAVQEARLDEAGLVEEDGGASSSLSSFLESTEFSGWVAASYNQRVENWGDRNNQTGYFLHPNSNTFALDQAWFEMDKAPTEDDRGGFHVDFLFGENASALGSTGGDVKLYSAYVSYLAPIANGVQVDAGILPTLLGAEVAQAPANFNVTRGLVYGLQPITHTGVLFSTDLGGGLGAAFGVVNDVFTDTSVDDSFGKTLTGQVSYGTDMMSAALSFIVGADSGQSDRFDGGNNCKSRDLSECNTAILDLLLTADPSDNTSVWLNFDWVSTNGHAAASNAEAVGLATALRQQVLEHTSVAGRFEFVWAQDQFVGASDDLEQISLTATIAQELTSNLEARLEGRWDRIIDGGDPTAQFAQGRSSSGANDQNDQVSLILEMLYNF